jgi:hypothetical protein
VKVGMEIDYKHAHKLCTYIVHKSTKMNVATVRTCEVISDKFNVVRTY